MLITDTIAKDILLRMSENIGDKVIYDACEEFGCVAGDLFPTFDELILAIEEGEISID